MNSYLSVVFMSLKETSISQRRRYHSSILSLGYFSGSRRDVTTTISSSLNPRARTVAVITRTVSFSGKPSLLSFGTVLACLHRCLSHVVRRSPAPRTLSPS